MGEIEDLLTVATLVVDRFDDPAAYVAARIGQAERTGDAPAMDKWRRVQDAVRAMLSQRRAGFGG
ncbi:MAG: hypothetical protein JO021_22745 [Alphaproteobacteria bacterium]|nr:hypothetical protein [Alphaproteobacteria bacterium]